MNIAFKEIDVKIDDATFTFLEIGKDDAFKYVDPNSSMDDRYQIMLDALVKVEGIKSGDADVTLEQFKEARISINVMQKILTAFVKTAINGEDKEEKNAE